MLLWKTKICHLMLSLNDYFAQCCSQIHKK
jgi:hypothetical protein